MKTRQTLMQIGDWASTRAPVALVPAALVLSLLAAPMAQAACIPNRPASNTGVVCDAGIDTVGVSALPGATNVSVSVTPAGAIATSSIAIQLGGGSNVGVAGSVSSSNSHAIYAVGTGGQDIAISPGGSLMARSYGILAEGRGLLGGVDISNAGFIGGLLNDGAIRATSTSTEFMRVSVVNTGLIAVDGTGGGINAIGYQNSTVTVANSGRIVAAAHGLRAQGQAVSMHNSGTLDLVGSATGYGIYGEATFTTARRAEVEIVNDAAITFSEASGYGVGIWAQARVSNPDTVGNDHRGKAMVTNRGTITGAGGAATGILANGRDEAEIVNRAAIQMAGTGAGLSAESELSARIDNDAAVTARGGITMSVTGGSATLLNSGDVTGSGGDAARITARFIDVENSGALRGGSISGAGLGLNLVGQLQTTLHNSGRVDALEGAILASATGSGGRVSVTNTGILGSQGKGIDVLGDSGAFIDNGGAVGTAGTALLARSAGGAVEVLNTGALTMTGSANRYRIATQVMGTRGSVRVDNGGRLLGGGGISAALQTAAGSFTVEGDATVTNTGEMFIGNAVWGIDIQARLGTATIDNQARIDSDGGGFVIQAAKALVNNRGLLDVDGRNDAISVRAANANDSFARVVNSGDILLNEKSVSVRAVKIDVVAAAGTPTWGEASLFNRGAITSLGTGNSGIVVAGTRANVVVDHDAAIAVQGTAIDARSSDGNVTVLSAGALSSTQQHGVLSFATGAGDILIDSSSAIMAQVGGIYASAAQGVVDVVSRGAIAVGTAVGTTAGGIQAVGARVALLNHGDITMSTAGSALTAVARSSQSDVRITNHGRLDMGTSSGVGISASAGFGPNDDRFGFVHVNNQGDIVGTRAAGIDAFGELSVVITNNGLIDAGRTAIGLRTGEGGLGSLFNDRNGQLITDSDFGSTVRTWNGNDIVINAGVITNRSTDAEAKAIDLLAGDDVMELERASKITGIVDGGIGNDALRWGGSAGTAAPGRFDMASVGTQYVRFERFEKTGSSTWILEGVGSGIDRLQVREGTARVDGVLGGGVTVMAGGVLGGNGRIEGDVRVEAGGVYAPGASIGSQTLGALALDEGAVLQVELDAGGLFDSVTVLGDVQLGGELEIHFLDATGFEVGWRGSFLQAASVAGAFSSYRVTGLDGTAFFDVTAGADGVELVLTGIQITPVPEPAAGWLFALGLGAVGLRLRRRRS